MPGDKRPKSRSIGVRVAPAKDAAGIVNSLVFRRNVKDCFNLKGATFSFDRSYVYFWYLWNKRLNLESMQESIKKYPNRKIAIFGHTDAYERVRYHNKSLSDRRALSVFAVLTQDWNLMNQICEFEKWTAREFVNMAWKYGIRTLTKEDNSSAYDRISMQARRTGKDINVLCLEYLKTKCSRIQYKDNAAPKAIKERKDYFELLANRIADLPKFERRNFALNLGRFGCSDFNLVNPTLSDDEDNRRIVVYLVHGNVSTQLSHCKESTTNGFLDPRTSSGRRELAASIENCAKHCRGKKGDAFRCEVYRRHFVRAKCEKTNQQARRCRLIKELYTYLREGKGTKKSVYECTLLRILERCWDFNKCKPASGIDSYILNPFLYNYLCTRHGAHQTLPYRHYIAEIARSKDRNNIGGLFLRKKEEGDRWMVVKKNHVDTKREKQKRLEPPGYILAVDFFSMWSNQVSFFEKFVYPVFDDHSHFKKGKLLRQRAVDNIARDKRYTSLHNRIYSTSLPIVTYLENLFSAFQKHAQRMEGGGTPDLIKLQFAYYYTRETIGVFPGKVEGKEHLRTLYGCFQRGSSRSPGIYEGENHCVKSGKCDPEKCANRTGKLREKPWIYKT